MLFIVLRVRRQISFISSQCLLVYDLLIHDVPRLVTVGHIIAVYGCKMHQPQEVQLTLHFLREAVDLPMRDAPILDWLAMTLPPLAVLGLVL